MDLITNLKGVPLFEGEYTLHTSEGHSISSKISDKPSEDGYKISDNAIAERRPLDIDIIITKNIRASWNKILQVVESKKLEDKFLNIYTVLETYENMILKNASATLDSSNNKVLIAKLSFIKPTITQLKQVKMSSNINLKKYSSKKKKSGIKKGNDLTDPKTDKDKHKSSLLFDLIGGKK